MTTQVFSPYKAMVDRFLGWKLPQDFVPDAGISFLPLGEHASHFWPVGTNLLTADQAMQMFMHCFKPADIVPVPDEPVGAEPGTVPAPSWQLRVIEEKSRLDSDLVKLEKFIAGPGLWKLHLEDAKLLQDQALFMRKYSLVLEKRIARFGA